MFSVTALLIERATLDSRVHTHTALVDINHTMCKKCGTLAWSAFFLRLLLEVLLERDCVRFRN